jgi:lipopolysaccharide export system protein LptA
VLLVGVLVVYIGYGRFKALLVYRNLMKHAGVTISHDTNGFTYSQTEQGRTIFTLHAAKATQLGEGQWALHDVAVTLYGRQQDRTDHITGAEFTYNEKEGVVQALGEVHIDLEAPQSLTTAGRSNAAGAAATSPAPSSAKPGGENHDESANVIHIRTSGLRYLRKLGVAATDQPVEFHYSGIECTALGAEFDSSESTLRLLANVVADGVMHNEPVHITAANADIDRNQNIVTLAHTVATAPQRKGVADNTTLHLRKDGSVESARASGHVVLSGVAQQVSAAVLDATLSAQAVPQTARLSGGVTLVDNNALRPLHGGADSVDIAFDAQGAPTRVIGNGTAQVPATLSMADKRVLARGLQRNLQSTTIVATFASSAPRHGKGSHLVQVQATGAAQARSEAVYKPSRPQPVRSTEVQLKTTSLGADDLRLTFIDGTDNKPHPEHLYANGHTLLQQDAPLGEQQTSSADTLEGTFAASDVKGREELALATAVQTGHVVVHRVAALKPATKTSPATTQQVATATADRASYDAAAQKLTLSGSAHLTQDNATLTATSVVLDQRTQDADAFGNVQATLENANTGPSTARAPEFTHVLASSAHFAHDLRQAEFRGTDAQPARMWQQASQVQAAVLALDDLRRTFSAHAAASGVLIHAVLANEASGKGNGHSNIVRVASIKMDYSDVLREAVFSSGTAAGDRVEIDGTTGSIHAQRATAYLSAEKPGAGAAIGLAAKSASSSPFNGSLERIVIVGDVQLDQPGRHGTGEQLVYTAATGESILTGSPANPPHITDVQQGSITGTTLLFGDSGSTIVVSGEKAPSQPNQKQPSQNRPARVHTETHLQSGTVERQ